MKRYVAIALAAVLGGAVGAALTGGAASASTVPFHADFGLVMPGETREVRSDVVVPVLSTVTTAGWDEVLGEGAWGAELCDAWGVCTPVDELAGATLAAGTYGLVLGLEMPSDASGAATSGRGRIVLTEVPPLPLTEGGLAATGGGLPWIAGAVGAAAVGGGAALVLRRRRETEEEVGS